MCRLKKSKCREITLPWHCSWLLNWHLYFDFLRREESLIYIHPFRSTDSQLLDIHVIFRFKASFIPGSRSKHLHRCPDDIRFAFTQWKSDKMTGRTERDTIDEQEFLRRQHAARQLFNYATSHFADVASIFCFFFPSSPGFRICRPDSTAVCYFTQRPISIITRFSFVKLFFVII